jgi:acetoin utilization protein AcuB
MRAGVVTIGLKNQLHEAAHIMREKHIRHLPVVAQGSLLGMITDRDLRRACGTQTIEDEQSQASGDVYLGATTVLVIMTKNVRTIAPDASLLDAINEIVGFGIGALPVVENDSLVGILTDTDIVRAIGRADT